MQVTGEASLTMIMESMNVVTGLFIEVPGDEISAAGNEALVIVKTKTENGGPLPFEAASKGLRVKLTPPHGGRQHSLAIEDPDLQAQHLPPGSFAFPTEILTCAGEHTASCVILQRPRS